MMPIAKSVADRRRETGPGEHDHRLIEKLIRRLPQRMRAATHWLRRPSSRWVRIPAGVLLVFGGFLSILPVFGLWMLPFGLFLLAEDLPPLRRARGRMLDHMQRRWPHWFETDEIAASSTSVPRSNAELGLNKRS
jgi:hypothetical protein